MKPFMPPFITRQVLQGMQPCPKQFRLACRTFGMTAGSKKKVMLSKENIARAVRAGLDVGWFAGALRFVRDDHGHRILTNNGMEYLHAAGTLMFERKLRALDGAYHNLDLTKAHSKKKALRASKEKALRALISHFMKGVKRGQSRAR